MNGKQADVDEICFMGTRRGTYTPYKRWSKCSVEKVRGDIFATFFRNLEER